MHGKRVHCFVLVRAHPGSASKERGAKAGKSEDDSAEGGSDDKQDGSGDDDDDNAKSKNAQGLPNMRRVPMNVVIEPVRGRIFQPGTASPFIGLESVWNLR